MCFCKNVHSQKFATKIYVLITGVHTQFTHPTCMLIVIKIGMYIYIIRGIIIIRVMIFSFISFFMALFFAFHSFGQSAVFLIGGESKAIQPQALLLRSGDVVVMSGPSRLAYHGVPKVLGHSEASLVPETLSQLTLAGCLEGKEEVDKDSSNCRVCGKSRAERDRGSVSTAEEHYKGAVTGGSVKSGREGGAASVHLLPERQRVDTGLKTGGSRVKVDQNSRSCPHCVDLLQSWPDFESYLSVSRINLNVRQVNPS